MIARIRFSLFGFLISLSSFGQTVSDYFEKIRNNDALLTAFFAQMPKGGDLHHHYSGSIYTETYIDYVVSHNYFINRKTLNVSDKKQEGTDWADFATLKQEGTFPEYKQKLFQKWSVKDYNHVDYPSDKLFFESFGGFGVASRAEIDKGLLELKNRAKKENVSYIETLFVHAPCSKELTELADFTNKLRAGQTQKDIAACRLLLDSLYTALQNKNVRECATSFIDETLTPLHTSQKIDDRQFTMRYQSFVVRTVEPVELFKNLIVAFEAAVYSPLVVGVNIVAPEDNELAMSDYWLHMLMFRYCHEKYPAVRYSMHAGELALGMVRPEDLTWHIRSAVYVAGANRIGHGVDLPYETDCYDLLRYMSRKKIAIEINLFSNEFILKVKDDRHPISLYQAFGVPIVISSDDAGVLRTNLTDQYVLLAKRYRQIAYQDIKQYVFNSIRYSFIEEEAVKKSLLDDLKQRFLKFERSVPGVRH